MYNVTILLKSGKATESDTKARVNAIHDLKEKVKKENDNLKEVKRQLKELSEKQKREKEVRKNNKTNKNANLSIVLLSCCTFMPNPKWWLYRPVETRP